MNTNACPRCGNTLPDITLRALSQGTTCPFCAAPLKRTPRRPTASAPSLNGQAAAEAGTPAPATKASARATISMPPPPAPVAAVAARPPIAPPVRTAASARPASNAAAAAAPAVTASAPPASSAAAPAVTASAPPASSAAAPAVTASAPPASSAAAASALAFDPQSIFESVTVTQDLPPSPALLRRSPARPPRKLALIALGAGLATVALGFAGSRLLGGARPAPSVARKVEEVRPPAPAVAVLPQPPAPAVAALPQPPAPPDREAPAPVDPEEAAAPVERAPAHRAAADRTSHRHATAHRGKRHERHASRMKVVVYHPAAKRGAAPPEHTDPRTPYEHGNALLFAGDGKGAIAAYREAVRSAPSDPIGFRGLGLAYEQQGESAQAVRALRRYLKLAPNAPDREMISRRIERLSKSAKKS